MRNLSGLLAKDFNDPDKVQFVSVQDLENGESIMVYGTIRCVSWGKPGAADS